MAYAAERKENIPICDIPLVNSAPGIKETLEQLQKNLMKKVQVLFLNRKEDFFMNVFILFSNN